MKQRMIPRILPLSKSITKNKTNAIERLYFDYKRISVNNKDKKIIMGIIISIYLILILPIIQN